MIETLKPFQPFSNDWKRYQPERSQDALRIGGFVWEDNNAQRFLGEPIEDIREKFLLITLLHPLLGLADLVACSAFRVFALFTGLKYWGAPGGGPPTLREYATICALDVLRIVIAPFAFIVLEVIAIYGIFSPLNGRKLYMNVQAAAYGGAFDHPMPWITSELFLRGSSSPRSTQMGDFFLSFGPWQEEVGGETYDDGTVKYRIDPATGKRYLNESQNTIRAKCLGVVLTCTLLHPFSLALGVAQRILRLVTLSHFWTIRTDETSIEYVFTFGRKEMGKDILWIVAVPIGLLGLELAAIGGIISPDNGRKIYADFEGIFCYNFLLAPCFQPDPTSHFFGGDLDKRDAY